MRRISRRVTGFHGGGANVPRAFVSSSEFIVIDMSGKISVLCPPVASAFALEGKMLEIAQRRGEIGRLPFPPSFPLDHFQVRISLVAAFKKSKLPENV